MHISTRFVYTPPFENALDIQCAPSRLEIVDLKAKTGGKLSLCGGAEGRRWVCMCVSVCIYTQVASRVLTNINFVSIFVLPVVK